MLNYNVDLNGRTVLVTGAAGFIGSNLSERLCATFENVRVVGVDSITDYYDVGIKYARLERLSQCGGFVFEKGSIADKAFVERLFVEYSPAVVVNLAAQAGVRYSITNPDSYIESNIIGFYNILEACRHHEVEHLVYASSSSVYGSNVKVPYSTDDKVDNPVSLYAATKKSNELMAHAYAKLYDIPSTGLRFFTVYGPAGRPDMAYFGFTDKLRAGKGKGYLVWAERNNIDAISQTVIFLKEHHLGSPEELEQQIDDLQSAHDEKKASIRQAQNRMKEINRQRQAIRDYRRTKEIYTQFKESGWSAKFYQEHHAEIEAHKKAQAVYELHDGKLPTLKELTAEYVALKEQLDAYKPDLAELKSKLTDLKHIRYNYKILIRDIPQRRSYRTITTPPCRNWFSPFAGMEASFIFMPWCCTRSGATRHHNHRSQDLVNWAWGRSLPTSKVQKVLSLPCLQP